MAADEKFFQQLTAERQRVRHDRQGALIREWFCPKGVRNEQTDCLVYAYAMLQLHRRSYNAGTYWDQMEQRLKRQAEPAPPPEKPTGTAALESRQPRRRGGFVRNW
jgi:phage terminase large subunit GpA-like protein